MKTLNKSTYRMEQSLESYNCNCNCGCNCLCTAQAAQAPADSDTSAGVSRGSSLTPHQ